MSGDIADCQIELSNGTLMSGIDDIIFATGYRYTYPFLPQFHDSKLGYNDHVPRDDMSVQPIVTDGTHLRSLYLDAFYIPDPTLTFINGKYSFQLTFVLANEVLTSEHRNPVFHLRRVCLTRCR